MMLDQITRRLAEREREAAMHKEDAAATNASRGLVSPGRAPGSKVVAVDVDPEMYAQLAEVAKKHGVRGVRAALELAARAGLRHL